MAYDHALLTSEVEFFNPPDDDTIARARLVVCANAENARDAEELMSMLGIHFTQNGVFDSAMPPPPLPCTGR